MSKKNSVVKAYLNGLGLSIEDIYQDDDGLFYFSIEDNGEVSDPGYRSKSKRVRLPDKIQKLICL